MANIDKTSVRSEVSRLKTDFDALCADGKVNAEIKVIMSSMLMILELMLSIFLERNVKKDCNNSSKPPSQTDKDESSLSQPGSNGKGKNENNTLANNTRVNESVTLSEVSVCDVCAEDLSDTPCSHHERRTRIDIVFEKVDETSFRVDKKNHWIHVYSSGDITLKFLHRKRGKEAIIFINIIPRYGGVIIHDCWSSYLSYHHCEHGLCGSHLLCELTFIVETNGYAWAGNMKRLLQETCVKVSKREDKKLTDKERVSLQKR